ncbi:hypothetical protein [Acinetobacter pragensis]|uniref:hypothetical protein n=1 Tax=Acinetobacter pragensis TaxID=1806892 RepID=UPI00333FC275
MKRSHKLAIAFVVLLIIVIKLGLSDKQDQLATNDQPLVSNKTEAVNQKRISPADKIDLHAYSEYKKDSFPRLYSVVGDEGFKRIFQHDMESAYKVAERNDCDRVIYSAYSEKSNYPSKIISFVRCQNGNVFDVSGTNIEKR